MDAKSFLMNLPSQVKVEMIADQTTVFHFILTDEVPSNITMSILNGVASAVEGLVGEPKCVVKSTSINLMKIVNRELNPMMAMLTGKLKISNQSEMMKYAKVMGLM